MLETGTLPPYAYVPGRGPHPILHPEGHSHGGVDQPVEALTEDNWSKHEEYRRGFDLFHGGYFWEAHETWEGVWRSTGDPRLRALLQALIQLAAAIVKMREGRFGGVPAFAARIREKLRIVSAGLPADSRLVGVAAEEIERALGQVETAAMKEDLDQLVTEFDPVVPR